MRTRKARCDQNHAIYVITNIVTGEQYVGLTLASGNVKKRLKVRMQKHAERARNENKGWALCNSLREYGAESFVYGLLEIVRGKKEAHAREIQIIREFNPALNTF
jgi:group I intron endonuclease